MQWMKSILVTLFMYPCWLYVRPHYSCFNRYLVLHLYMWLALAKQGTSYINVDRHKCLICWNQYDHYTCRDRPTCTCTSKMYSKRQNVNNSSFISCSCFDKWIPKWIIVKVADIVTFPTNISKVKSTSLHHVCKQLESENNAIYTSCFIKVVSTFSNFLREIFTDFYSPSYFGYALNTNFWCYQALRVSWGKSLVDRNKQLYNKRYRSKRRKWKLTSALFCFVNWGCYRTKRG